MGQWLDGWVDLSTLVLTSFLPKELWTVSQTQYAYKDTESDSCRLQVCSLQSSYHNRQKKIQNSHWVFKTSPYAVMPCPSWISLFLDTRITHTLAGNLYLIGTHMEYWPDVVLHYVSSSLGKIAEKKKTHLVELVIWKRDVISCVSNMDFDWSKCLHLLYRRLLVG